MRKEAKEKVEEIISEMRETSMHGISAGAAVSAFFAGVFIVTMVVIGIAAYLNGESYFGTRQWSAMSSLVIVIVLSLIVYFGLTERCGCLLMAEAVDEDTDDGSEINETDDANGESSELSPLWIFATSALICVVFFAWLFMMGGFCYAAGKMDDAGFSVTEVTVIETLVAIALGITLSRFCKRETH